MLSGANLGTQAMPSNGPSNSLIRPASVQR